PSGERAIGLPGDKASGSVRLVVPADPVRLRDVPPSDGPHARVPPHLSTIASGASAAPAFPPANVSCASLETSPPLNPARKTSAKNVKAKAPPSTVRVMLD